MQKGSARRYILLILVSTVGGMAVWGALRFTAPRLPLFHKRAEITPFSNVSDAERWAQAIEQVKADRGEQANASGPGEVPAELRHYEDRHWFLATQVAEVKKHNVATCQDFVDLAAMVKRGDLVSVPFVTDDYVLFGVGARADDRPFTRSQDDHTIGLYSEAELRAEYQRLDERGASVQNGINGLKTEAAGLKKNERSKQSELQKEISARQQDLTALDEEKQQLDQFYGDPASRQKLLADYESLQALARNFGGRSFDLDKPADREVLKISLLSSLRPQAFTVLKEIAAAYHRQFNRPLPVSSLIRPEEYQHALRRVNRAATTIDTPPHSTGLAFDIDYRYMSGAEQAFVMNQLAQMKRDGRIEVLRERNANYHVFAFIDGQRPADDLVAASLDDVGGPAPEANHAEAPAKTTSKKAKSNKTNSRKAKPASAKRAPAKPKRKGRSR